MLNNFKTITNSDPYLKLVDSSLGVRSVDFAPLRHSLEEGTLAHLQIQYIQ